MTRRDIETILMHCGPAEHQRIRAWVEETYQNYDMEKLDRTPLEHWHALDVVREAVEALQLTPGQRRTP